MQRPLPGPSRRLALGSILPLVVTYVSEEDVALSSHIYKVDTDS